MQNSDDKRFSDFFGKFRLLKEKHDAIAAATGARFNIFSVLDREHYEVKTHSRFLAEMLNPKGAHSRGAAFLRLLFDMLQENFPQKFPEITDDDFEYFDVSAEADAGDLGRIDILLENREKCIVIENKIYAGDQEQQLDRYHKYAVGQAKKDESNVVLIYLTLWGGKPGKNTWSGDSEKVLSVSYSEHIIRWLDDCIKAVVHIAPVRETLMQYQSLLKKLTNQSISQDLIMDFNQLLSDNHALIPDLEKAIREFKSHVLFGFWSALKTQLDKTGKDVHYVARDPGFRKVGLPKIREEKEFKEILEGNIDRYIGESIERGILAISLEKIGTVTLCLSIAKCYGQLFYGFSIVRDKAFLQSAEDRKEVLNKLPDFRRYADRVRDAVKKTDVNVKCGWGRDPDYEKDQEFALGEAFPTNNDKVLVSDTLDENKRDETIRLIYGQVSEIAKHFGDKE
ncbi:MAG: PD-(D/E)XK nuclease family protein [Gammaproteobacteria bacterium]|nr:PD-(D/E)XK nuclease family protein [Gammaproteobacteria bacterium]CAJ2376435.1 MAG: conserved hypothetical protein [Arenicellales bacterium IbO2]MDA7961832.1 PD-(D/E)XK nuclease family protein [Gammaproteobacteria bacterium]MDA7969576.1 PD-(D/E)XK nuclease family protein [Gammaproteobacteria bacterium]MDA7972540.1 PD-(D/E)XK nuclease family protein [Gammaproteobacteria bacterium]